MFRIARHPELRCWVLYGGEYPSGSIKYLTFGEYLLRHAPETSLGFIEMSGGSTALALDHWARQKGVPCRAVTNKAGQNKLLQAKFSGEIHVIENLQKGMALCEHSENLGWHWPRQFTNPRIVSSAEVWCHQLAQTLNGRISTVVTGFGTGATAAALQNVLGGRGYRVIALQSALGCPLPGFRNYAETNLGKADLFRAFEGTVEMKVSSYSSAQTCFEALCAEKYGVSPDELLIISHDEKAEEQVVKLGSVFS